mgnify:FL=1
MKTENKTILITGASAGIGRAIAERLAKKECRLFLTARRIELLEEIKNHPGVRSEIEIFKCDVSRKEEVAAAYKKAKEKFGKIDIAILNAGTGSPISVESFDSLGGENAFGINFFGVVYWIELLIKDFIENREGIIAGISSLADNRAYGATFYNPSKAALSVFLEGMRLDLRKYNIKVLTVKPGFVNTYMTSKNKFKMPFVISPDKAAGIIIRGIEKEKNIIQFPMPMVLLTRFLGLLPSKVFDFLISNKRVDVEN